jgi:hypothetical protein
MCSEIKAILVQHGWDKVVLVSHSYRSIVSTHLLKTSLTAHLIGPVLLIDPVSILLHLPDVAYNFTRRKPKRANEHQLHYFASRDIGVSHALSRHFFWAENALWEKDIEGRDVTVSLAGKDLIVNTEAVRKYLMSGDLSGSSSKESSSDMTDSKVARDDPKSMSVSQGKWMWKMPATGRRGNGMEDERRFCGLRIWTMLKSLIGLRRECNL